jgi:hypothetical protein
MQTPPRTTPRETTEAMVRNIGRELAEIEQGAAAEPADRYGQKAQADQRFGVTGRVQRR